MTEDVRDEAQRLVAAALAAASFALRNAGRGASLAGMAERFLGGDAFGEHIATGTPECCVCPVCRGIAALRDPNPEFAAKVASGASDLAAGLTTILRAFNAATARPQPAPRPPEGGPTWRAATHDEDWPEPEAAAGDDPWQAATRSVPQPRKVAKKAVRKPPPAPPADEPA